MVEQLNAIARLWWEWSVGMFWQVGLLILLIAALDRLIRRWAWPQLRYALWSLILIKLVLPPSLSLPSGIVPELQPVVQRVLARLEPEKPDAAESHVPFFLSEDMLSVRSVPVRAYEETYHVADTHGGTPAAVSKETPYGVTTNESPLVVWQVYAMMASLLGTLILGIWLFFRLRSLVGRNAQVAAAASLPQSFYNQLAGCARRLELHRIPRVVVTARLATPAVFGVFRPVLLMPRDYLGKLSQQGTEHMLLHELAHIKRGDLIAHGLYMLLQIVYWYNPLLWLVRRQVHHLRELSCDATVAELLREQTAAYRQTLLETARRLLTSSVEPGLGLLGLFEDSNRLLVRLDWLTKPTWRHKTMKRIVVTIVAALMLACVLPMARAQEAASNQEERVVTAEEIQLSQQMNQLQAQLDQLKAQQEELQDHLRTLAEQRARITGQRPQTQASAELGGMARSSVPRA
jgi:beta-lactamase regulating signal transducer with metallopeptidase domain